MHVAAAAAEIADKVSRGDPEAIAALVIAASVVVVSGYFVSARRWFEGSISTPCARSCTSSSSTMSQGFAVRLDRLGGLAPLLSWTFAARTSCRQLAR
jgi:hypothetical protein